jgi:hypothetical protein
MQIVWLFNILNQQILLSIIVATNTILVKCRPKLQFGGRYANFSIFFLKKFDMISTTMDSGERIKP